MPDSMDQFSALAAENERDAFASGAKSGDYVRMTLPGRVRSGGNKGQSIVHGTLEKNQNGPIVHGSRGMTSAGPESRLSLNKRRTDAQRKAAKGAVDSAPGMGSSSRQVNTRHEPTQFIKQ